MSDLTTARRRSARLALPALALVLAAALSGCGDAETAADDAPPADPTPTAPVGPTSDAGSGGGESEAAGPTLDVTIDGDEISPNAEEIDLAPGDTLLVTIDADRDGELHVHSSPEQYVEFEDGEVSQELTFDTPGSIEIEEHGTGAVIALVEVS